MTVEKPDSYADFLARKHCRAERRGFEPDGELPGKLFPFQKAVVRWACRRGTAAIFAQTGLGKTCMELAWAQQVFRHSGGSILILCPLAVAPQTRREGKKFGIPVTVCRKAGDVKKGINVTNYEMLDHFDPKAFAGVVIDESSILKGFARKRKQQIVSLFASTPYRLSCTATPAPNDHLELGNQAEFLGVMPSNEMISRWFINDTMSAGKYRLKGHAAADFWRWCASWAVSLVKPSDIGDYDDTPFILPPLNIHEQIVDVDAVSGAEQGMLFRDSSLTATNIHREMRLTCQRRAEAVADLIAASDARSPWLVWCNTNYEADAVTKVLPQAVEVRGSDSIDKKEKAVIDFADGKIPALVSKPRIFGWGVNWQACHRIAFVGLSFSFEQQYQAIRRCWRFGQKHPVDIHLVRATTEGAVAKVLQEKQARHDEMQREMCSVMREAMTEELGERRLVQTGSIDVKLPEWLRSKIPNEANANVELHH